MSPSLGKDGETLRHRVRGPWALVVSLFLLALTPRVFADSCFERATSIRQGSIPYGQPDGDCDAGGKAGAYFSWFAAGAAAAAAARAAARRTQQGKAERPNHWPTNLTGPTAFCELGTAIAQEDYLQTKVPTQGGGERDLNDIEKTLYLYERMREAARVYGLKAPTEGFDFMDKYKVGLSRRDTLVSWGVIAGATLLGGLAGSAVFGPAGYLIGPSLGGLAGTLAGILGTVTGALASGAAALLSGFATNVGDAADRSMDRFTDKQIQLGGTGIGAVIGGLVGTLGGPPGVAVGIAGGGILGTMLSRLFTGGDQEEVDSLKMSGVGHCGEWSLAFSRLLKCAGVAQQKVAYADHKPDSVASYGFGGTDTTVIVKDGDGKNRVFDIFREMYESKNKNLPSDKSVFSNLPMTAGDLQPYDSIDQTPRVWQKAMKKEFIKDNQGNVLWQQ
ncbi:MAG: hypothetical protein ABJA98_10130 [Acidobacteriota bacterium]